MNKVRLNTLQLQINDQESQITIKNQILNTYKNPSQPLLQDQKQRKVSDYREHDNTSSLKFQNTN